MVKCFERVLCLCCLLLLKKCDGLELCFVMLLFGVAHKVCDGLVF